VPLKGDNAAELPDMVRWAHARGMGLTLIETMPLGEIEADRTDQYLPLSEVRADFEALDPDARWSRARAVRPATSGSRRPADVLGFITPMSHNFCEACNRVRVTCTGDLVLCLGREDAAACGRCCATIPMTMRLCARRSARPSGQAERARFPHRRPGAPAVARPCRRRGLRMATVKLFGVFRDLAGWSEPRDRPCDPGRVEGDAGRAHPGLSARLDHATLVIRNALLLARASAATTCRWRRRTRSPSGRRSAGAEMIRIQTDQPFEPGALLEAFCAGRAATGAVASFTGLTRANTAGSTAGAGRLSRLHRDRHQAIEAEARARFEVQDILAVHRWGPIAAGEPIVFVAVAAGHRRAAFEAVRLPDGPVQEPRALLEEGGGPGRRPLDRAARSGHADLARWETP
jgi:molybdopterin synthase catalytic subunit